jgi:AI-2E family transporter
VGFVVAAIIVAAALGAVSEIVLPLTFAAVLAVIFKPAVAVLERHRVKPTLAAGLIVLGLLALMTAVIAATVRGITDQTDEIGDSVDKAIGNAVDTLGIDQASLDSARAAVKEAAPAVTGGFLTHLLSGVNTLVGFASGLILGAVAAAPPPTCLRAKPTESLRRWATEEAPDSPDPRPRAAAALFTRSAGCGGSGSWIGSDRQLVCPSESFATSCPRGCCGGFGRWQGHDRHDHLRKGSDAPAGPLTVPNSEPSGRRGRRPRRGGCRPARVW